MPLYEYHCERCDHDFELLLRGDERPACPDCQTAEVTRLMSAPARPADGSLSVFEGPAGGGCGLPQCGAGRCQGLEGR